MHHAARFQLVIGNKSYSSWSMRPGVLLRQAGIVFDEVLLRFDGFTPQSQFKRSLAAYTPVGKVPVLIDREAGGPATGNGEAEALVVWDTLAIAEYLAETHPALALWPADARARARARSVCAEMHAGFGALRSHCPMNLDAQFRDPAALPPVGERLLNEHAALRSDLDRIVSLWTGLLQQHGGPLLFGRFSIADAYFAPVCNRLRAYGLPVPPAIDAYIDTVFALPGVKAWVDEALAEHEFLEIEEPYRPAPAAAARP